MKKNINSLKRFERKWVFNNLDLNQICIFLYKSNFFFTNQYLDRKVNSIYFDDLNYSSIRQNLDGVSNKKKYRIRWYGDFKIIKNPVFEIKTKNGFEVKKENYNIKELEDFNFLDSDDLNKITLFINNKFNLKNKLIPILTTHYLRSYFVSSNNLIRATLDTNIKSLPFTLCNSIGVMKEYKHIILEIKYNLNLDHFVRNNIKNIPVRFSKISKFVNSATTRPDYLS